MHQSVVANFGNKQLSFSGQNKPVLGGKTSEAGWDQVASEGSASVVAQNQHRQTQILVECQQQQMSRI